MRRKLFGVFLVDEGIITPRQLSIALYTQERLRERRIGEVLVELGCLDPASLARVAAEQHARLLGEDGSRPLPFGQQLVEDGLVTRAELRRGLDMQERYRAMRIGDVLFALGFVSRDVLEEAIRMQLEMLSVA
jgi:hypothetical protein